jgi:ribonuclease VapC
VTLVVDTSAVVAMAFEEPSAAWIAATLGGEADRRMSTASAVELGIVLGSRPKRPVSAFEVISALSIELVTVNRRHAEVAVDAWRRYGKGRHRAGLNYGDCFSYALAAVAGVPLLCVGDDFARTDLQVLRPPQ